MADVVISADDLTGANACAAGFAKEGLRAVTSSLNEGDLGLPDFGDRFDAVVVTTDSRHLPPAEAEELTRAAIRAGWPARLAGARIDTTMRGNIGPSALGAIDEVRKLSGERTVGLALPAFPNAGRVTIEGRQLLEGRRLEDTELARDVRTPVTTSLVEDLISEGTGLNTALVPLHVVAGPHAHLVSYIKDLLDREDLDVIVADALTNDHITQVAEAAVAAGPEIRWVGIDPGPGSLAIATALGIQGVAPRGRVLAVSGSASDLTQLQLNRLIAERDPIVVQPHYTPAANLPDVEVTSAALIKAVNDARPGQAVLYAQVLEPADLVPLTEEEIERLPGTIGEITANTLKAVAIDGIYSTGGDITAAILDQLGSDGVEIHGEVIPLAVSGEVVGGPFAGLSIITKGGLIGGPNTAVECIDELSQTAQQRSKWVRTAAPA